MTETKRFRYDPNSPLQRRADALALSRERFHADLVRARRAADVSQEQLAARIGVSQPTIAAFERYENDPRLSTVIRYAHGVGVLVDFKVSPDVGQLAETAEWSQFRKLDTAVRVSDDRATLLKRLARHQYGDNVQASFGQAA